VAGRAGLSIAMNLALPELSVSPGEFGARARELTADLPRLSELRRSLRDRMRGSPLMNAPRFAQNVERAYRTLWRRWCT
jgi:predicted O-linked N-acetylglucosamine transferase (SPINDLY family)